MNGSLRIRDVHDVHAFRPRDFGHDVGVASLHRDVIGRPWQLVEPYLHGSRGVGEVHDAQAGLAGVTLALEAGEGPAGLEIVNPNQHLAYVDEDGALSMVLEVGTGHGFQVATYQSAQERPIGYIPVDAIFSPVRRVNFDVERSRVGQDTSYDRLVMEVWTDGTIRPRDLPDHVREAEEVQASDGLQGGSLRRFRDAKRDVVEEFERRYLYNLMERHGGNVTAASGQAGMLRSALQRLLRKYELKSAVFRKNRRPPTTPEDPTRSNGD